MFKLRLYEASGNAFQKLFSAVMQYALPGYQAVAPWGSWGDGGNDGWCPQENRYFQVYGPEATTELNTVQATAKAIDDFGKLKIKWPHVERYHFVCNDRYCGMPAPIGNMLLELAKQEKLLEATPFSSADLTNRFMNLLASEKMDIVYGIPSELPDFIDPNAVSELLTHLADSDSSLLPLLESVSPDFHAKIALNGIKSPVTEHLSFYFYQVADVDRFLSARDTGLAQKIAIEINALYQQSKDVIPDSADAPNERYVWLVDSLIPSSIPHHPHTMKAYRQAAQVIIAKYFETCDAYEHPNSINPS
nr:ABC-three component system protein [Geotalea sp. SG265]